MVNKILDNYSVISAEYYNRELHPTCYNFGLGNHFVLQQALPLLQSSRLICEVGAGRSSLLEYLPSNSLRQTLLTDSSAEMLEHSRLAYPDNFFLVCDAAKLPLLDNSVDLVVSLLGDPYNTADFWREVARVIRSDGSVLFTTPSWEWAAQFRALSSNELRDHALFYLENGSKVYVPSFVYSANDQIELARSQGFQLREVFEVPSEWIVAKASQVSSKVSKQLDAKLPIVVGYLFDKTG